METIGDKIKTHRKVKGLSLMELAKLLEVSDTALSKIETGKTKSITIDLGKGIAKALGISFNDLFEIETMSESFEMVQTLKKEYKKAINRTAELNELLDDKRKLLTTYESTVKYYDTFSKYAMKVYLENKDIKVSDLYDKVQSLIQMEKGFIFIGFNDLEGGLIIKDTGSEE